MSLWYLRILWILLLKEIDSSTLKKIFLEKSSTGPKHNYKHVRTLYD